MSGISSIRQAGIDNVFYITVDDKELLSTVTGHADDNTLVFEGNSYRLWSPTTSKLASMIVKGMKAAKVPEENIKGLEGFMGNFVKNMDPAHKVFEAQAHAFMAAVTAIYAAKSVGVDSCPMQGFDVAGVSKLLGLPANLVPTLMVPLGYPADKQMPKARFSKEEMVF